MYLIDTNIILELLLNQDRAEEVEQFLQHVPPERLWLSEFALYSLGIILFRYGQHAVFQEIVQDLVVAGGIRLVRLEQAEMGQAVQFAQRYGLDFDDAYQYAVAEIHDLVIVSFDGDFDGTERGRRLPDQVLAE